MKTAHGMAEQFARHVQATTEAKSSRAAYRSSKRVVETGRKIIEEFGEDGKDALVALLSHERLDVRVEAATQLLGHRTEDAVRLLEKEAGAGSFLSEMALKNWREGNWNVGPPPTGSH